MRHEINHGDHLIVVHGVHHEQYWRGAGISGTDYRACYSGIGSDSDEAFQDAAEQAVSNGEDDDLLPATIPSDIAAVGDEHSEDHYVDHYVYVTVYIPHAHPGA